MAVETTRKRGRKTVETRLAEIDEMIANLLVEKERLLWPAQKQQIFEMVPPEMSPQEFADRLGIVWGDAHANDDDDSDE